MADDADRAQLLEEQQRLAGIAAAQLNKDSAQWVVDGQVMCVDCGDAINPKRLAIKPTACRCTECQGYVEEGRV